MAENQQYPASPKALYLKQVRIRNYAPLLDATVDFQQGLNIILGPNGVGKTRFLSLTSQLITPFGIPDIGADCELVLGYDLDIKINFQQISLNEELTFDSSNTPRSSLSDIETELGVVLFYKGQEVIGDDLSEALWAAGIRISVPEVILAKHGTPLQQLPLADLPATLTFRVAAGRIKSEPESETFTYSSRPLLVSSIFGTIGHLFARNRRYQRSKKITPSLTINEARVEVERIIDAYLAFLNPYIFQYSSITQIRLSNTYQVYDNTVQNEIVVKGLVLEYLLGGNWLPFSALSDGTRRILYLITQLVMPVAHFDSQQTPPISFTLEIFPRTIFLEEPELGVHHSQLHKLLKLIREVSAESQVILTTHAPQVLDMLSADELDRITICSLDPEKGTQFHKLTEEKQEQARVYMKEVGFLSDYWRYSYLEETVAE